MKIENRQFIKYKLINSLFLGISVGSIFTIYTPLEPSIYSIGGILLALAMLFIAKLYSKIINIYYFYRISIFVELAALFLVLYFLIFSYSYMTALLVYAGYQITFTFGSYLVRAETVLLRRAKILTFLDVAKQKGYLIGMGVSYIFYKILENYALITSNQDKVYNMHFLLLAIELLTIYYLLKSFRKVK
jgi:putative membrane protein